MGETLTQLYRMGGKAVEKGRKALQMEKKMTVSIYEVPVNLVPASAVIREGQVFFGQTGRKASVG